MLTFIALTAFVALAIAIPVARAVRRFCVASPASRLPSMVGAAAALGGAAFGATRLDRVAPHMRESPAALVPILGATVAVGLAALLAIAVIVGAALSVRSGSEDLDDDIR